MSWLVATHITVPQQICRYTLGNESLLMAITNNVATISATPVIVKVRVKHFHISVIFVCSVLSPLRLPPRYRPIWTIYIPFWSPWLIDFRNARFDLNFDVTSFHVERRNVQCYFLGVLQHENKDTREKRDGSKYFLTYYFINLLVIFCFTQHLMSFIDDATFFRKSRLHQILGQLLLCL